MDDSPIMRSPYWLFVVLILLLAGLVYLVVRKNPYNDNHLTQKVSA